MPTPEEKLNSPKARVSVDLRGTVKKKFFDEIIKEGMTEAQLVRKIISQHYDEKPNHMRF